MVKGKRYDEKFRNNLESENLESGGRPMNRDEGWGMMSWLKFRNNLESGIWNLGRGVDRGVDGIEE